MYNMELYAKTGAILVHAMCKMQSWILTTAWPASLGHQRHWYQICSINRLLSNLRMYFYIQFHHSVGKLWKCNLFMILYVNSTRKELNIYADSILNIQQQIISMMSWDRQGLILWNRLSIYRRTIWHDIAHRTIIWKVKLRPNFEHTKYCSKLLMMTIK